MNRTHRTHFGSEDRPRARNVSLESLEQTQLTPGEAAAYAARAIHTVTFAVGGATIAVRFARASAALAFSERFRDLLAAREPDTVIYAVDVCGAAFFWGRPEHAYVWNAEASDELLVFFADGFALREYLNASADFGLHAAVLALGSHLVALVGHSTAGKTTTALAAVRRGFALYSDERCIVQDGRVVPFLRAITVRAGGRSALRPVAVSHCEFDVRLRELPERGDIVIGARRLIGERAGGPARPLTAAFIIEGRAATPGVWSRTLYAALPALLRSIACRETGLERAGRALAELRTVRLYGLRLGTPDATVEAIERALK